MLKQTLLLTALSLIAAAPAAFADTVTDSADNVAYSIDYTTTASPSIFDVYLTIDASQYSGNSKLSYYLNSVALQLGPNTSDYTMTLLSAPSSNYGPGLDQNKLSATGCNASGSGFYCLPYNGSDLGLPVGSAGDIYTFEFQVTAADGFGKNGLYAGDQDNAEANYEWYNNGGVLKQQLDNETGLTLSPAPEPSSLALLGTGIVAAAGMLRRRLKS